MGAFYESAFSRPELYRRPPETSRPPLGSEGRDYFRFEGGQMFHELNYNGSQYSYEMAPVAGGWTPSGVYDDQGRVPDGAFAVEPQDYGTVTTRPTSAKNGDSWRYWDGSALFIEYYWNDTLYSAEFGPNVPWTPAEITTQMWYDAADTGTITESGGAVSQWDDKSGNGYNLTQGSGVDQPQLVTSGLNGVDCLQGDGVNSFMSVPYVWPASDFSVFVVGEYVSSSGTEDSIFGYGIGGGRLYLKANSSSAFNGRTAFNGITGLQNFSLQNPPHNGPSIYNWAFDLGVDNRVFVDATDQTSGTPSHDDPIVIPGAEMNLFSRQDGSSPLGFKIGEFVAITDVTQATRQLMEGYLAWKWGLEGNLPIGHPYKNVPPEL